MRVNHCQSLQFLLSLLQPASSLYWLLSGMIFLKLGNQSEMTNDNFWPWHYQLPIGEWKQDSHASNRAKIPEVPHFNWETFAGLQWLMQPSMTLPSLFEILLTLCNLWNHAGKVTFLTTKITWTRQPYTSSRAKIIIDWFISIHSAAWADDLWWWMLSWA